MAGMDFLSFKLFLFLLHKEVLVREFFSTSKLIEILLFNFSQEIFLSVILFSLKILYLTIKSVRLNLHLNLFYFINFLSYYLDMNYLSQIIYKRLTVKSRNSSNLES